MTNDSIRIVRDDLAPYLSDKGISSLIEDLAVRNCPSEVMLWEIQDWAGLPGLTWDQLHNIITDLKADGKLAPVSVVGTGNVTPVIRPPAPSGIGCANGNVWANAPNHSYIFRFYVNGVLKLTMQDSYITDLATIGAVSGDVVQICEVAAADVVEDEHIVIVKGTVGWWTRKTVP